MLRRALGFILALGLLGAAPAAARTVHYLNFRSPSKQIFCVTEAHGLRGVECGASYLRGKEVDGYLRIRRHGRVTRGERGDYVGYPNAPERTLRYGDAWTRRGIRCVMRRSGLTCRNRSGHGFRLAKGDVRRF